MRTPTEILELFLDDEVFELIVTYSNLHAAGKGVNLGLTTSEFKCFWELFFWVVTSQFLEGVCCGNKEQMRVMYLLALPWDVIALKLYFLICTLLTMQIWTQWTSFPSCDLS
jgi:hypothetical protein